MTRYRCDCGATDCPSCGPAQGYEVRRVWDGRRFVWRNPEPDDEPDNPSCDRDEDLEKRDDV